ncbi:MAG: hypothetical protein KGL53_02980 [Elusimicrobia bacterium]|nr:hypothetical protein [Elusimicrobiota bacterium]
MPLAALLLSAALPAAAGTLLPACVRPRRGGIDEPATLSGLLACQARARAAFQRDASAREALGDFQRGEVRGYLARHPDRATTDDAAPASPSAPAPMPAVEARSRAAVEVNGRRLPAADRAAYQKLDDDLWKLSGGGKLGLTPAMAREITGYLQKEQGGQSAEMSDLLRSLQKDGSKLSDGSVIRLKKAARDAKGEGLDLGVDPKLEKWLLDPKTDPAAAGGGPDLD